MGNTGKSVSVSMEWLLSSLSYTTTLLLTWLLNRSTRDSRRLRSRGLLKVGKWWTRSPVYHPPTPWRSVTKDDKTRLRTGLKCLSHTIEMVGVYVSWKPPYETCRELVKKGFYIHFSGLCSFQESSKRRKTESQTNGAEKQK